MKSLNFSVLIIHPDYVPDEGIKMLKECLKDEYEVSVAPGESIVYVINKKDSNG